MFLQLQKIMNENSKKKDSSKKTTKEIKQFVKELSPKTLRKNKSSENFLKFQWPWTL